MNGQQQLVQPASAQYQAQQPVTAQQPQQPQQFNYQQQADPNYSQPPAQYVPQGASGYDAMSPLSTPGMRAGAVQTQSYAPMPSVADQPQHKPERINTTSERLDPKQISRPDEPKARAELIKSAYFCYFLTSVFSS